MRVVIQLEAQLREAAGRECVELDVPADTDVQTAVRKMAETQSRNFQERLLSESGGLLPTILVFVNERPVPSQALQQTKLASDSTILLLPPISGG